MRDFVPSNAGKAHGSPLPRAHPVFGSWVHRRLRQSTATSIAIVISHYLLFSKDSSTGCCTFIITHLLRFCNRKNRWICSFRGKRVQSARKCLRQRTLYCGSRIFQLIWVSKRGFLMGLCAESEVRLSKCLPPGGNAVNLRRT